jgi:hypothetical protein
VRPVPSGFSHRFSLHSQIPVKLKIRVANPVSGELTYISRQSAERYVARGRAHWRNYRTIVFVEDSHDRKSALESFDQSRFDYDRIGSMTREQIAGVPVIGDITRLFTKA